MRSVRADLVIATIALLVSTGATLSSLYQTHVIANQLSASVWPYLDIEFSRSQNSMSAAVINDGLGPAIIRSATLSIDGRPFQSYKLGLLALEQGLGHQYLTGSFSSIGPTTVIRPGEKDPLFALSALPVARLGALHRRVSIDLCYCSLLDQCWKYTSSGLQVHEQISACDGRENLDYL